MIEVGLEHAFTMRVSLSERMHMGKTPRGYARGFVGVKGGTIDGPRLQGEIVPDTGGDYPFIYDDGSATFEAKYFLRASDGTLILLHNRGFRHGPKDRLDALLRGEEVDPGAIYFRLNPRFEVPEDSPHVWMTKTVFIGVGNRKKDHSVFTYYAVT